MDKEYKLLMFDLDGTINDSGEGIMESVQYALDHFDMPNRPEQELRRFVGPSLVDSFTEYYHFPPEDVQKAVALFRKVYESDNLLHLTVYPGMNGLLEALHESPKYETAVVTSKPYKFVFPILEKFGLKGYFSIITGTEVTDPSSDKSRLIDRTFYKAMELFPKIKKEDCLMIGDTRFDIEGAKKSGVDSVGVTYGYGTRQELEQAGAKYIVDSAQGLGELLGMG